METLISYLKKWSKIRPDNVAVEDEKRKLTYDELANVVAALQKSYREIGIRKGDVVGVSHVSSCFLVANYLALFGLGVFLLPLPDNGDVSNYLKIFREIVPKYILYSANVSIINEKKLKIKFLCENTAENYIVKGREVLEKLQNLKTDQCIELDSVPVLTVETNSILTDLEGEKQYLNITSGSTGKIKIANVATYKIILNAMASNNRFPLNANDNYCCLFSTGMHPHELFARPLIAGSGNVLLRSGSIGKLNTYVKEKKITQIVAVPAIYKIILQIGVNKENWKNIKYLLSGGEVTNYFIRNRFYELTGKKITPVWGSTETTGLVFYVPDKLLLSEKDYIGVPVPEYQVKVDSRTGRLMIKGEACFDGYCNVDNMMLFTEDGFYLSDDLVYRDEDGVYQDCGRIDGIVKIKGKKISLSLIKKQLEKLDGIMQAEVLCIEQNNEKILGVFCVMEDNKKLSFQNVDKILCDSGKYQIIHLENMPLLPSNKIDRKTLELIFKEKFE